MIIGPEMIRGLLKGDQVFYMCFFPSLNLQLNLK